MRATTERKNDDENDDADKDTIAKWLRNKGSMKVNQLYNIRTESEWNCQQKKPLLRLFEKNVLQSWSKKDVRTFVYAQQVATNYVNKCTNLVCIKYWTKWRQKLILNTLTSATTEIRYEMVRRQMSGEPEFVWIQMSEEISNTHTLKLKPHCASFNKSTF